MSNILWGIPGAAWLCCGAAPAGPLPCAQDLRDCLLDEAAEMADAVVRPGLRDEVHFAVAVALAQAAAGDTDGAIATAARLADDMLRGVALAGIAPLLP